ncbi:twin arginine translocase protein A [endosymbiont of Acanthamoeba sp. UWC8]|nr:twin-arginine translocase TatA/TatE family subunit [endosymbiont of Acanthamoeba sp. UWC8]AIF81290.1 twin arginine translocase protein A [endosymbiont of Acanthamoeba sp. UWC8]
MSGRLGELLLILLIIFVIFGAGKLPKVMGELGRGIRSLRDGVNNRDKDEPRDHKE